MTLRHRLLLVACAVAVTVLGASPAARAGNEATAEALFLEAKRLVGQGKFAEACPKFAESNRLDRGAGTLIHLGDCYEKNKQTASAWAAYKEAASAAQALNRSDWQKLATQRASALEPKLARLVVKVDGPVERIVVTRDGAELSPASWGVALPVDVGTHAVEANAPGFKPFRTSVTIAKDAEKAEVVVAKLEPDAKEPKAVVEAKPTPTTPKPVSPAPSEGSSQKMIGYIVAGVGVAGLAVGGVTGLMAIGKSNDSKTECAEDGPCGSQAAVDAADSAKTFGLVSTIGFIAGGAAVVAGAVLIFTAPSSTEKPRAASTRVRVAPSGGPSGGGLVLSGTF